MSEVPCFWIEPLPRVRRSLHRYQARENPAGDVCPGRGYHDASVDVGEIDWPAGDLLTSTGITDEFPPSDPRWPATCDGCGYTFAADDTHQVNMNRIYVRPETGETLVMLYGHIAPGAMWHLDWLKGNPYYTGPDGLALAVALPNDAGQWWIDGPSSQGGNWQRTGTPPKITVTPSVHVPGKYHGWLRDGVLVD